MSDQRDQGARPYVPARNVGLVHAEQVLRRARDFAAGAEIKIAAVVVDAAGHPVAAMRMDGAPFVAVDLAREKAWTAAALPVPTATWADLSTPGARYWGLTSALGGRLSVLAGGTPLTVDGHVIGAVGVSGGTDEQDHGCALRAAEIPDAEIPDAERADQGENGH